MPCTEDTAVKPCRVEEVELHVLRVAVGSVRVRQVEPKPTVALDDPKGRPELEGVPEEMALPRGERLVRLEDKVQVRLRSLSCGMDSALRERLFHA